MWLMMMIFVFGDNQIEPHVCMRLIFSSIIILLRKHTSAEKQ